MRGGMKRYRFKTKSVKDYRPLVFNPAYPWWCSGTAGDGKYATIICYLPDDEEFLKYWDDAYDIDSEDCKEIVFSDRLSKPEWYIEAAQAGEVSR